MHSQTLQALRAEIEAVTTLQLAFNRIAQTVDPEALSTWDGPRPEDVDDAAGDDGSFSREVVTELRAKAGAALGERYREVERVVAGRAALESLLRSTLATGTGGAAVHEGPPPADMLSALARSGALRVDWAAAAAVQVRDVLDVNGGVPEPRPTVPDAPKAKKVAPAPKPKKKAAAKKKTVKKAAVPKKKAAAAKKAKPKKKAVPAKKAVKKKKK
jgi:outer membrane biosynthesis protein TonB